MFAERQRRAAARAGASVLRIALDYLDLQYAGFLGQGPMLRRVRNPGRVHQTR